MKLKPIDIETIRNSEEPWLAKYKYAKWRARERKLDKENLSNEKSRIYNFKNRDKINDAAHKRRRKLNPLKKKMCKSCNKIFQQETTTAQLYCTPNCRDNKYYREHIEYYAERQKIYRKRKKNSL